MSITRRSDPVSALSVGVLGPLIAERDGVAVDVTTVMLRRLLALLAAQAGRPLPLDVMADTLWAGAPPVTARKTLLVYIHRLRRLLGADGIRLEPAGYVLDGEVDAAEFTALVARMRHEGDPSRARELGSRALGLWRGSAYGEFEDLFALAQEADRLEQMRVAAIEDLAGVRLRLGEHRDLVEELGVAVDEHPFRERLREHLMLALYRAGRVTDALQAFHDTRVFLAEQFGIDPSPGLRQLHQRILCGDPTLQWQDTKPSGPRLLPPAVGGFLGRDSALAWLDDVAGRGGMIGVISGIGGVGKTALAVHWANRVAERFPDGLLFINLHGYDQAEPMSALRAIATLLRALGIAPEEIPSDVDAAVARYRAELAGRRVLLVLDNAASVEQVRPLLPSGPACAVVVTSRNRLTGLIARDGAYRLDLDLLAPAAAEQLLTLMIGAVRAGAEPAAVAELARLCGHLPLALRVAGGVLSDDPRLPVAALVTRLRADRRLDQLALDGDPQSALRVVFDYSYRRLPATARRLFRRLAAVPGPDIDLVIATALNGESAEECLGSLVDANLVINAMPDRYALHDLLREYAGELLDAEGETSDAFGTVMDTYLRWANTADLTLRPYRNIVIAAGPVPDAGFDDSAAALGWFDREGPNLIAAVLHSAGPAAQQCWQLAVTMHSWIDRRRRMHEGIEIYAEAAAAARSLGDRVAEGLVLSSLGVGLIGIGRQPDALPIFDQLVELARTGGDRLALGYRLGNLGSLLIELRRADEAVDRLREAIDTADGLDAAAAWRIGTLGNLALAHDLAGQSGEALIQYRRALTLAIEIDDDQTVAYIANNFAEQLRKQRQFPEARQHIEMARARSRAAGDLLTEVRTHLSQGELAMDLGDVAEAKRHLARAEELYPDAPDDLVSDLRERLPR